MATARPDVILDGLDVPHEFRCPITQEVMLDPVVCADGHTYERGAIRTWLRSKSTSPKTNERLKSKDLLPNHALRSQIQDWCDKHAAGHGSSSAGI